MTLARKFELVGSLIVSLELCELNQASGIVCFSCQAWVRFDHVGHYLCNNLAQMLSLYDLRLSNTST